MTRLWRILAISGSVRTGSTNAAALETAKAVAPEHVEVHIWHGITRLPHFNPDDDVVPLDAAVTELRTAIGEADMLLLSTPEYAGALPGSFKNLLDWTIGGGEIYGKPVAWINVAGPAAPSGGADAHDSLRKVLTYAGVDLVEAACRRVPVTRDAVGQDGVIDDMGVRENIRGVLDALIEHVESAPAT